MASCDTFEIPFPGSADDLFLKISLLIQQHGGSIAGNAQTGTFNIPTPFILPVKGIYSISGHICTIQIIERSFFLSCDQIETFLLAQIKAISMTSIHEL